MIETAKVIAGVEITHRNSSSALAEELRDRVAQRLKIVVENLRQAKKTLARDWSQMTPRERSAASRLVKEIEQEKQSLLDTLAMNP